MIFVDTKLFADSLGGLLNQPPFNIKSTALHGDRSQEDRDRAFEDFKVILHVYDYNYNRYVWRDRHTV